MNNLQLNYFLGVLSPAGYAGYHGSELLNYSKDVVLLKGTPGCGKSTLIKKVAQYFTDENCTVECIHCALSPNSLDGVICDKYNFIMLDATAPHEIEPKYPVAYEKIMPLYYCLNAGKISAHRKEIIAKYKEKAVLYERSLRYMAASASLLSDTSRTALTFTNLAKASDFAKTLCRVYLPLRKNLQSEAENSCAQNKPINEKQSTLQEQTQKSPKEKKRFLSALTGDGIVYYASTIEKLANKIIVLNDDYACASKHILEIMRKDALSKGYEVISCYCSLFAHDKIEHLILPELSLAISTSNSHHKAKFSKENNEYVRNIHCERFTNKQSLQLRKKRLHFNKKASCELLQKACEFLKDVQVCHSEIEQYYINAADFSVQGRAYNKIIAQLK